MSVIISKNNFFLFYHQKLVGLDSKIHSVGQ